MSKTKSRASAKARSGTKGAPSSSPPPAPVGLRGVGGLLALWRPLPPADVPPKRWLQFIDDCGRFLDDGWAERAAALDWRPLEINHAKLA